MLFNSIPFLVFIVLFFLGWALVKKGNTTRWVWICFMSFLFYGWWDWRFLFLLIGTGSLDYFCGKLIKSQPGYKLFWLWVSLASNIGALLIFKYSHWMAAILDGICDNFGITSRFQETIPAFTLVIPVGLSFYTFNSMSYTIDLYRGKTKEAKNLLHFMAFISFFPHLVAGPIIRARDILQQLMLKPKVNYLMTLNGLKMCIWGFFQKMVLADNLAVLVNNQFSNVHGYTGSASWWFCMMAFAFQIYFDFNGYSSIARGIAKLCGIHFRINFNHPYRAVSFREFWRRWHISLSSFFRDYVYKSLGGNRRSKIRNTVNLWITMLLSGLWHGGNITFAIWGLLHALFLSTERLLKGIVKGKGNRIKGVLARFVFLVCVLVSWVFFRSESFADSWFIVKHMFLYDSEEKFNKLFTSNATIWIIIGIGLESGLFSKLTFEWMKKTYSQILFWSILVAITVYFRGPDQQFIYIQF